MDQVFPGLPVFYRTKRSGAASEHYAPYELSAPAGACPMPIRCLDDCSHAYLLRFGRLLSKQPKESLVYTRSNRMAWVAVRSGRMPVLELHDPLIPIRIAFLKKYTRLGRIKLLVVTTERLKADVVRAIGLPAERILVAGGGAASGYHDLGAVPVQLGEEYSLHVGYAGSALKGKGVSVVLACATMMPDVAFHLIGPSQQECRHLGSIPKNVFFHGY